MSLQSFQATNFRNLKNISLDLHPEYNLFYGSNGSGKTSILEAIYYLGMGKSFRSHLHRRIIAHTATEFSIFGSIQQQSALIPIGIERSIETEGKIRIANNNVYSSAELAKLLPLQLLNQNCYHFFEHGPKARRQFLDWGVFHVEHSFSGIWKSAERIIEQRNVLIKNRIKSNQLETWNFELATASAAIHELREKVFNLFIPIIDDYLRSLFKDFEISITYEPGWDVSKNLQTILEENFQHELYLGYTEFGPHRADLKFKVKNLPAQDVLSRGQLKLLLYVLRFALGTLLYNFSGKKCCYLVDDFGAELDCDRRVELAELLINLNTQVFITSLDKNDIVKVFATKNTKMFHVEHGNIAAC
ncbi:MAG: DNA replication/repair protein RecF [Gammaproteobacteria bacterium]|nr:DNA replication/repair protein RecF [Gammaproteobacteria bacterium]